MKNKENEIKYIKNLINKQNINKTRIQLTKNLQQNKIDFKKIPILIYNKTLIKKLKIKCEFKIKINQNQNFTKNN